ncbi:hypothetical protein HQ489_01280 [Candidatus Woesearchaeota archaeon]|nr:hypothetical protein [Candidatus Woesearchaeota archaeon]
MKYDFILAERNNVAALYVTNPQILEMDDIENANKPFLFQLNNDSLKDTITGLDVFVGRKPELEDLITGRTYKINNNYDRFPVPFSSTYERKEDIFTYLLDATHLRNGHVGPLEKPGMRLDLEHFRTILDAYDSMTHNGQIDASIEMVTENSKVFLSKPNIFSYLRRFLFLQ